MANEINIQAAITLQRSGTSLQGTGNKDVTQSGQNGVLNVQQITTSAAALGVGNVSFTGGGYMFVKNLDATNYVELATDSFTAIFTKLKAGEFCLFPVKPTGTIYARANTASVYLQVGAVEC
jgi:hypothetical protein